MTDDDDAMSWAVRVLTVLAGFPDGAQVARLVQPLADGTRSYDTLYRRVYGTLRTWESQGHAQRAGHARMWPAFGWGHGFPVRGGYHLPIVWQITAAGTGYLASWHDSHSHHATGPHRPPGTRTAPAQIHALPDRAGPAADGPASQRPRARQQARAVRHQDSPGGHPARPVRQDPDHDEGITTMTGGRSPAVCTWLLAAELRKLREQAQMTGAQLARRLGWSAAKVSRIETGATVIAPGDLQVLLDLYQVPGSHRDRLAHLAGTARQRGWWHGYADLDPGHLDLIILEAHAETVRCYAAQVVPALLQTEDYARALIASAARPCPPGLADRQVQAQMTRQHRLTGDTPLRLHVVLDEAVLARAIGGPITMSAQLGHLADAATWPNIDMRILPHAAGAHPAVTGGFLVVSLPPPGSRDIACHESLTRSQCIDDDTEVHCHNLALNQLQALAWPPARSRQAISTAATKLASQPPLTPAASTSRATC
jgi:transcriptional regulator with XRE-family HTH domain